MRLTSLFVRFFIVTICVASSPALLAEEQKKPTSTTLAIVSDSEVPPFLAIAESRLATALAGKELVVVDREHLSRFVEEQSLSASILVRDPVQLQELVGAEYLVHLSGRADPSSKSIVVICIEVRSGNVVVEVAQSLATTAFDKAMKDWIVKTAQRLQQAVTHNETAIQKKQPTATVLSIEDKGRGMQFRFLADSLRSQLEVALERRGYRVLRRRYAGRLSTETVLSTAGLTRPDERVLAAAADVVVTARYIELSDGELPFRKTPVELRLSVRHGNKTQSHVTKFTIDTLNRLDRFYREALVAPEGVDWDEPERDSVKGHDQQLAAQIEAAQLLATLPVPNRFAVTRDDAKRRADVARRIIYLDPTAKDGYYWLGMSLTKVIDYSVDRAAQVPIYTELRDAFSRYLQFPRDDRIRVNDAFRYIVTNYYKPMQKLLEGPDRQKLFEDLLRLNDEKVRWYCATDWSGNSDWTSVTNLLHGGPLFQVWWEAQPRRAAEYYAWVASLAERNPSLDSHKWTTYHAWAAEYFDRAGDTAIAAKKLHYAMILARPTANSIEVLAGARPGYFNEKTIRRYADHLTSDQIDAMLTTFHRATTRHDSAPIFRAMYGDYFQYGKSVDDLLFDAPRMRLERVGYKTVEPERIHEPDGVVHTHSMFRTEVGLWVVGVTKDPEFGTYCRDELFHLIPGDPSRWRRIDLPHSDRKLRKLYTFGAHHIVCLCQVGDEILWCGGNLLFDGTVRGGIITDEAIVYVHDIKTGRTRMLGVDDGLPAFDARQLYLAADRRSVWIISARGMLTRYREGTLRPTQRTINIHRGLTMTQDASYATGAPLSRGGPDATDMKPTITEDELARFGMPFKGSQRFRIGGCGSPNQRVAVNKDRVYTTSCYGLVEADLNGNLKELWYPDTFCRWDELGGYLFGNCPLPPVTLTHVFVDDCDPNRLWLISQDSKMRTWYGRPTIDNLRQRGLTDKTAASMHRTERLRWKHKLKGLFITSFDTRTRRWSPSFFVAGHRVNVQPWHDHLYISGGFISRIAKSQWKTDIACDPRPPVRIESADTPFGRAAQALLAGDVDRTMQVLQQAADDGIAPKVADRLIKKIRHTDHKDTP